MKKMTAFLMTLLMTVLLAVSVLAAETASINGTWYGEMFGLPMELNLKEDNTYEMTIAGAMEDAETGTWELKDNVLYMDGDESMGLTFDGESLKGGSEGLELNFTREEPETFTPANPVKDAKLEDFAGDWEADNISYQGIILSGEAIGMDLKVTIDGTTVKMNSVFMEMEDEEGEYEFKDGKLTASDGEGEEAIESTIELLEDGTIALTMKDSEQNMTFYMNKSFASETVEKAEEEPAA